MIMFLADGGPDMNLSRIANNLFYYDLFKKLDADILDVVTYAARYSVFNPIKHCWSPLSNKLLRVIFSSLENEDNVSASALQSGFSKKDLKIKEKIVFDHVMSSLSEYQWKDFKYDGLTVNTQLILVGEDDLLFTDYDHVLACLKSPIHDIHKYSDLVLEFKQMHGHIDCHLNEVVYVKCENRSCCDEFRSKVAKEILGTERRLPSPSPNISLKGHYNIFLQEVLNEENFFGDKVNPQQWKKILAGETFV